MKTLSFSYADSALVSHDDLAALGNKLKPEIKRLDQAIKQDYQTPYASVYLSSDEALLKHIEAVVQEKKALRPSVLIVIGIGGSNLGAVAIHQALYGKFYNEQKPAIKVYFADAVDTDYIYDIILLIEQEFEKGNNVLINVISKSGTTTETIANFELFFHLLEQNKKGDYRDYVVATTDEGSKLWKFAQKEKLTCLTVPKNVGGRYSVFSAVGLFPLAMLGVSIKALRSGARSMLPVTTNQDIFNNPAALSAAILYHHYRQGKNIHDTFLFSVDFEGLGKWYRQLMAESIGKEYTTAGEQKFIGMTPTVSIGTVDLHSAAQLYLGGPYDKVTTFISVKKRKSNVVLSRLREFKKLVANLQEKSLSSITDAIFDGVQTAYKNNKRPFMHITLPEKEPYYVGQLLQLKMIEMMYFGFLLDVNPFDQPHVELYKAETRRILAE